MLRLFLICLLFVFSLSSEVSAQNSHPLKKIKEWLTGEKENGGKGGHQFATLSSVGPDNRPYSRIIQMMAMSQKRGILFFTHRSTEKVEHFSRNPHAALNIWLPKTLRQISINGEVKEIPISEAEKSWKRMSRSMKLIFLSSNHTGRLSSPDLLKERKAKLEETYQDNIPMPETFIGYRFQPEKVTFYEITPRDFPLKEVSECEDGAWVTYQLEP